MDQLFIAIYYTVVANVLWPHRANDCANRAWLAMDAGTWTNCKKVNNL